MVIATIIAQKHNYPDSTGYPDLGGRDSMQYLCDRSENWTHFEVKASMQQVLEWWELVPSVYVPMGGGIRAKFLFHITSSDQNTPGEWGWRMFDSNGWYCNTEDCNGRIAESCGIDSPCWDFIHTDEAYVCAKWAEREIRAINGMQCQIDPITPQ